MILNEVLNSPVKFKWLHSDSELGMAKFFIDGNEVMVEFHEMDNPLPNDRKDPDYPKHAIDISFYVSEDGDHDSADYGITGGGNEYQVFSTVMVIAKEYIAKHKPEAITFSAEEPSRIKLYDRFMKRFTSTGYRIYNKAQTPGGMVWVLFKQ